MNFKLGDKVRHKADSQFNMVILGESNRYNLSQKAIIEAGSKFYKCRYYNGNINQWEEMSFFDFELEKVED